MNFLEISKEYNKKGLLGNVFSEEDTSKLIKIIIFKENVPITNDDILAMRTCGKVGRNFGINAELWFNLKNAILATYGIFSGYDKQIFYKNASWGMWEDVGIEDGEPYSEHIHILERWTIQIDEWFHIFHNPTNEFSFYSFTNNFSKKSENYNYFSSLCDGEFFGKKELKQETIAEYSALMSLKHKFEYLISGV